MVLRPKTFNVGSVRRPVREGGETEPPQDAPENNQRGGGGLASSGGDSHS